MAYLKGKEVDCVVPFVRLTTTLLKVEKFTRQLEYGEKQLLVNVKLAHTRLPSVGFQS